MTRRSRRPARRGMLAAALVLLATWGASAPVYSRGAQPNDPSIRDAIARGSQYLIRSAPHADGGRAAVGALGLVKTGTPADNPAIVQVIEQKLLPKFDKDGQYKPTAPTDLYYEAGVDLMVYANTRPQEYGKQISFLVNLLIDAQHEEGYWSYPPTARNPERVDTSITQYALLGLWDARRAGVPIPTGVFDKAASWLKTTQDSDGGFWYHPGNDRYPPTHSMVAAGTANLLVCRQNLFGPGAAPASHHANSARFGVLKKIELEPVIRGEGKHAHAASGPVKVARSGVDSGVRRGFEWLNRNWIGAQSTYYQFYYYYALERACSLAGVDKIGDHDWYDEISDGLLKAQSPDGGWSGQSGAVADTAFALLFLSRATAKIIHHKPGEKLFEGGLMIGGRGLPTNLSAIQAGADGIRLRKLEAPVDSLLSELENPKSTNVEAAQQAIVESVELGDREKLVGQKERLKRLCRDPRTEVRRTAIWALGRCATIRDANVLVRALDDPEISVVIEANNALCWLARRPNGFGRAADPIAELPEGATDQRKEVAARSWRKDVRSDWRTWFANVRPYAERNLPLDAN